MPYKADPIKEAVELLQKDISELEDHFERWNDFAADTSGGRNLRSLAKRIVKSAQRIKDLVGEQTYSPR